MKNEQYVHKCPHCQTQPSQQVAIFLEVTGPKDSAGKQPRRIISIVVTLFLFFPPEFWASLALKKPFLSLLHFLVCLFRGWAVNNNNTDANNWIRYWTLVEYGLKSPGLLWGHQCIVFIDLERSMEHKKETLQSGRPHPSKSPHVSGPQRNTRFSTVSLWCLRPLTPCLFQLSESLKLLGSLEWPQMDKMHLHLSQNCNSLSIQL